MQRLSDLGTNRDTVQYLIFGREVGESGTPHLQGFVIFNQTRRFRSAKDLISSRCHIEKAVAKSSQARDYCKKEGDWEEFGDFPDNQGKRTDLDDVMQWCDEFTAEHGYPPTERDLALHHHKMFVRYGKAIITAAELRAPAAVIREGSPRDWQEELENILDGPADDRKVRFYVDTKGGTGKSWFQGYYVSKNPDRAQLLGVGPKADIAYAIDRTKSVFLFNVPRGAMQFLQYTIFEQLKDRVVFSTKYHSCTKILLKHPHVVVFCNEYPDESAMSSDRYEIIDMHPLLAMEPGISN